MTFRLGTFSKPIDLSAVIHLKDPAETETLQPGDIVERWDHIFEWDGHCLKASQLEALRTSGDPLCDDALRSMFNSASSSAGVDLLERLESDAILNPGGPSHTLLEEASKLPPSDLAATPDEIREGQEFFLTHSLAIMQILLHFSLAGGFASPRITRVLHAVSYLVPPSGKGSIESQLAQITPEMNDRTYTRLLETFQFVLDVMGCTRPISPVPETGGPAESNTPCLAPGGIGWKSALRVRLLHGVARRRILDRKHINGYDFDKDGVPINQEDMAATLGSFSIVPIELLERFYLLPVPPPTPSQASAFIAVWRHVGFYLGIDPTILREHFSSPHVASKFLASSVVHLLTSYPDTSGDFKLFFPTLPILRATSNRPPFSHSFERRCALTQHVLGPLLASHLGVPPTPLRAELQMRIALIIGQIPVLFSFMYPRRGWSAKRRELTREALRRVLLFQMGLRRTTFRARNEKGELGAGIATMEAVKRDPVGAAKMVRGYRMLMLEMVAVIVGAVTVCVWGGIRYYSCRL